MKKYLTWFYKTIRPYRCNMAVMMLCHILLAGCTIAFVYVSKVLIDMATAVFSSSAWGLPVTDFPFTEPVSGNLFIWAGLFAVVILIRIFLNSLKSWLQTKTEISLRNSLRSRLYESLLHRSGLGYRREHSGDLVNRLQDDVRIVSSTFAESVPGLLGSVLQFVAAFCFLLYLEWKLALLLVVVLPIGLVSGRFIMVKIRRLTSGIRESDSMVQSYLQEHIQHLSLLQAFEHSQISLLQLDKLQDVVYGNELRRTRFSIASRVLISVAFGSAQAIAFLWGVMGIAYGTVTYGVMTAFLQLLSQIQRPLLVMNSQLPAVIHCTASVDRLVEIESMGQQTELPSKMMKSPAGVRFTDVCFAYDSTSGDVLTNFSHDFRPGTHTAVVGRTGSGKSTMVKLMLSLLSPRSGNIEIYDSSEHVPLTSAERCNFVFVPQGNSLFSGSVLDNLLVGNPDATPEQLRSALMMSAADFVYDLPQGLQTQCFESGAGLSEGQAQRVAVARALLRPGSVLLFDEFSSALDPETEALMMKRLTEGCKDKTMIFITHKYGILDYCDEVLRIGCRSSEG